MTEQKTSLRKLLWKEIREPASIGLVTLVTMSSIFNMGSYLDMKTNIMKKEKSEGKVVAYELAQKAEDSTNQKNLIGQITENFYGGYGERIAANNYLKKN